jgi:hypothetical protein
MAIHSGNRRFGRKPWTGCMNKAREPVFIEGFSLKYVAMALSQPLDIGQSFRSPLRLS